WPRPTACMAGGRRCWSATSTSRRSPNSSTNSAPFAGIWTHPGASPAMSPEAPAGSDLHAQLDVLAGWIREPSGSAPPGVEQRRLDIYRELFFNNVANLLGGNFPVLRRIHGDAAWRALVHAFYRDHGSRTPLFTELPREFLRYLETRGEDPAMPWLRELAHYEWAELALQISEATRDDVAHDADGDLLAGCPLPSPLAWPLAYAWPVHRIGPDYRPRQ